MKERSNLKAQELGSEGSGLGKTLNFFVIFVCVCKCMCGYIHIGTCDIRGQPKDSVLLLPCKS